MICEKTFGIRLFRLVITCPVKCGMKLSIYSQASNGATVEVREWINKFAPYMIMVVIMCPC